MQSHQNSGISILLTPSGSPTTLCRAVSTGNNPKVVIQACVQVDETDGMDRPRSAEEGIQWTPDRLSVSRRSPSNVERIVIKADEFERSVGADVRGFLPSGSDRPRGGSEDSYTLETQFLLAIY